MTKAAFSKLQREWYAKLKATGFQDIEHGRDLNEIPASTFRGAGKGAFTVALLDPMAEASQDLIEQQGTTLELHPVPEYWSRVTEAVYKLRFRDPRRKVLLACLKHGQQQAAAKLKIPAHRVNQVWRGFLKDIGLPEARSYNAKDHDSDVKPGKVKKLTKAQVRKLKYSCPRELP